MHYFIPKLLQPIFLIIKQLNFSKLYINYVEKLIFIKNLTSLRRN